MSKKLGIAISLLFPVLQLFSQKHIDFTQQLEGTKLSFNMVAIPAGVFSMGSKNGNADEQPVHKVKLDAFWMSKFEVTWDLFEPFLYKDFEVSSSIAKITPEIDGVARPTKPYLDMTFGMGKQNQPAVAMTQYNAIQFCKWLYVRTGVFYRLPTEAEWEYACKAGADGDYSFGNDSTQLVNYAWLKGNSEQKTHQVGLKKPNKWGLYDMHGNVAEWTYDEYRPEFYATLTKTEAKNPVAVADKPYPLVTRGGSFTDDAKDLRSAARKQSDPSWKQIDPQIPKSNWWFPEAPFVGIRLVRPVIVPTKTEIDAYYNKPPIKDF